MENLDPAKRFSNRVQDYIKYRPGYPSEIISFLKDEINYNENWNIVDVGSGTGILSELFLKNGNKVFCIEPNLEMRLAGENLLKSYMKFISINGTAESIPVENNSIDLVTAGQAFHWFDVEKTKKEFKRILKPEGWVVLIWNERLTEVDDFSKQYEKLLQDYSIDYSKVDHRNVNDEILNKFFTYYKLKVFPNKQEFDFDGLKGRLLSSSYVPKEEHPNFHSMINKLKLIYDKFNSNDKVIMKYETKLFYGKIN